MVIRRCFSAVLAAGVVLLGSAPSSASVELTIDFADGFQFSGVSRSFELDGVSSLPLGDGFDPVTANIHLSTSPGTRFDVRAVFPGQGGQTVIVNDGDRIDFEIIADLLVIVQVIDVDPAAGFGAGLGNVFRTKLAQLQGSGVAIANTLLPNLGLLSDTAISFLLGTPGANLIDIPLGVDLNGDGTNDVLSLSNLDYDNDPPADLPVFRFDRVDFDDGGQADVAVYRGVEGAAPFVGTGSVNPSFGFSLDVTDWEIEQAIVVPAQAVPEPAPFVLLGFSALLAGARRRLGGRA